MTYRGAGVYVFRTRRPGMICHLPAWFGLVAAGLSLVALSMLGESLWFALLGLLFNSRHTAYVGESTAVRLRKNAHLFGGGRYKATPKPWSDLSPTWYYLPLPGAPKWVLRSVETLGIVLLWPVYNDAKNRWNPRRVSLKAAKFQRDLRDRLGWSFNVAPLHLAVLAGLTVIGVMMR